MNIEMKEMASEFRYFWEKEAPKGWHACLGEEIRGAEKQFPELWQYLAQPENAWKVISPAEWAVLSEAAGGTGGVAYFAMDERSGTLRFPDLRGDYMGGVKESAETVGQWQTDAIRNLTGRTAIGGGDGWGLFRPNWEKPNDALYHLGDLVPKTLNADRKEATHMVKGALQLDASRQVPTAEVNRPRTINLLPCIYVGCQYK